MAIRAQIRCINKQPRINPHERISAVGGVNPDGNRWKLTLNQAIAGIESGQYSFYVQVGREYSDVYVAVSGSGHKYLKTRADNTTVDNLLSLPECP